MVNIWVSAEVRDTLMGLAGLKQHITKEDCAVGEIVEFLLKVYETKILEMSNDEQQEFLGGI